MLTDVPKRVTLEASGRLTFFLEVTGLQSATWGICCNNADWFCHIYCGKSVNWATHKMRLDERFVLYGLMCLWTNTTMMVPGSWVACHPLDSMRRTCHSMFFFFPTHFLTVWFKPLETLFMSLLNDAQFKVYLWDEQPNQVCVKCAKCSLSMPSRLFCYCYELFLVDWIIQ